MTANDPQSQIYSQLYAASMQQSLALSWTYSQVRVCKKWLDTITNMGIAVPTLAMADFSTGVWLVFLGLHISASAPFYVKWLHYSVFLAVFKCKFCAPQKMRSWDVNGTPTGSNKGGGEQ
eukprot:scaffold178118_cov21-Tisochrysis_lutea.AAC.1